MISELAINFARYLADSLPQGYFFFFAFLQYWKYSGASMPIKRIGSLPISRLSPSITFAGNRGEEVISCAVQVVNMMHKTKINGYIHHLQGVYIFDNFLFILGLSIYYLL